MTLPPAFCERMERLLGAEFFDFQTALDTPITRRGVRANLLKCSAEKLEQLFPYPLTPTPFAPEGYATAADIKAGAMPLHHAGAFYMQENSAMSAVSVLHPLPGEWILDTCAAPGSKTTQIAGRMRGKGLLWANEYVFSRAKILAQNIERCGVRQAVISSGDTALLAENLPAAFDGVLVDAPCSGEGMFRKEPVALEQWSEDNIALCARRQMEILDNAARTVAPGGRLVFSTCTFAPEENEWSVIRFLQRHPDFSLGETGASFGRPGFPLSAVASFALPEDTLPDSPVDLTKCRRVLPQDGGEGHFIALFRRTSDGISLHGAPVREAEDTAIREAKKLYSECFSDTPTGIFSVVGDTVRLLPTAMPTTSGMQLIAAGIAVARIMPDRHESKGKTPLRLEPCHQAFMATQPENCRQLLSLSADDPRVAAFLRGEEIDDPDHRGFTAVAVEGIVTGFGKTSGGRLKNRYPKGLRLLMA